MARNSVTMEEDCVGSLLFGLIFQLLLALSIITVMIFACAEGNDPGEEKKDEEQKKRQAEAEANAHVGCCCGDGGGGGGDGGGGCGGCGGCGG